MKKYTFIFLLLTLWSTILFAQSDSAKTSCDETCIQMSSDLDNLLNNWYVKQSLKAHADFYDFDSTDYVVPVFPDSIISKRLNSLASSIELPFNQEVRSYIDMYTIKKRKLVSVLVGLSTYYFPIFEKALDEYNLPHELKYLAIIESALNPRAVSRCKATGLWQFMYNTAKMYDIEMNSFVDDRRDPIKSSYLAARHLRDLYSIYNDWQLVLAAYNCGPGNVNKAMKRSGGKTSFWEIYPYLPKETRGYVPAFISAVYTMNYYSAHKIYPRQIEMPHFTDTILVYKNLNLQQVADVLSLPVEQLKELNPQYKNDIIPSSTKGYPLRLPTSFSTAFIQLEDTIYNYKKDAYFPPLKNFPLTSLAKITTPEGAIKLSYKVKKGDNLFKISTKYNVSVEDIKNWNKIRKNAVIPGKYLVIYLLPTANDDNKTAAVEDATEKKTENTSKPNTTKSENKDFHLYKVVSGDSLSEIAKKMGVNLKTIQEVNKQKLAKGLFPGQVLKIPKS